MKARKIIGYILLIGILLAASWSPLYLEDKKYPIWLWFAMPVVAVFASIIGALIGSAIWKLIKG